jgi:Superinfection immunity protein
MSQALNKRVVPPTMTRPHVAGRSGIRGTDVYPTVHNDHPAYQPYVHAPVVLNAPKNGAVVAATWIFAFLTAGYMLPWAIAATRGKSDSGKVGLVNFLLGWTIIGWVVALVMACKAHPVAYVQHRI